MTSDRQNISIPEAHSQTKKQFFFLIAAYQSIIIFMSACKTQFAFKLSARNFRSIWWKYQKKRNNTFQSHLFSTLSLFDRWQFGGQYLHRNSHPTIRLFCENLCVHARPWHLRINGSTVCPDGQTWTSCEEETWRTFPCDKIRRYRTVSFF